MSFFRQQKARRDSITCKKEIRIQIGLDRLERLPGRNRTQLNRQKRNIVHLHRNNQLRKRWIGKELADSSSLRTRLLHKNDIRYTCAKTQHICSVWTGILLASHECIPFSQSSASKISFGLQYHVEIWYSKNRATGKTKTTHKSNKTITGLESRVGLSTRYPERELFTEGWVRT